VTRSEAVVVLGLYYISFVVRLLGEAVVWYSLQLLWDSFSLSLQREKKRKELRKRARAQSPLRCTYSLSLGTPLLRGRRHLPSRPSRTMFCFLH
jgi:hypothetical protein